MAIAVKEKMILKKLNIGKSTICTFQALGTSGGTISSLPENRGGGNKLKKQSSYILKPLDSTDLFDNDFPAKNFNIS